MSLEATPTPTFDLGDRPHGGSLPTVRVVVVDDEPLARAGCRMALEGGDLVVVAGLRCRRRPIPRLISGRYPDDPGLTGLVGELTVRSAEFAELWAAHSVGYCGTNTRVYRHPVVGRMELAVELMALTEDEGQRVAVYTAETGSSSEAALQLLAGVTRPGGGAS